MRISVFGTGYVGLVTSVCFADLGNNVIGYDIDKKRIELLKSGRSPIYEPGVEELLVKNMKMGRLIFTADPKQTVKNSEIIFIAVGTPQANDGSVDLKYVKQAATTIGKNIESYKIIVNKSTVPVGMANVVRDIINNNLKDKNIEFDVVSNPEFLREGSAVYDFMNPDRIVIGTNSERASLLIKSIYRTIKTPILVTTPESAELIKYASNAMLATRVSFINEIANLCEKVGGDIDEVSRGIGFDKRIGPTFLNAGIGYGGSCFPKDTKALSVLGKQNKLSMKIIDSVIDVNNNQRVLFLKKIKNIIKKNEIKKVGVLGLSFKPNTDDIRNAPSIDIIRELIKMRLDIKIYDPASMDKFRKIFPRVRVHGRAPLLHYCNDAYDTAYNVELLIILTDWNEFKELDLQKIKSIMKKKIIVDGRNIYPLNLMKELGFQYYSIGR
ncbi:MAG: UDP-glucose/GDP-mannose dehydrogenase family protein [Candidatus Hydrogenedentota bacterium]